MKKNYSLLTTGIIALSINSINAQCPVPSLVTASPSAICAGKSTTLNATATGASINWFNVPSAGTSLGTSGSGANIAFTPTATTIYYAESFSTTATTTNFVYTGAIQNYTVPVGVTQMSITAIGAAGGNNGGFGASMFGVFTVTPGQVLKLLVGRQGQVQTTSNVGGGGGSFVSDISNVPLIVAGGGGGRSGSPLSAPGINANTTTNGNNGYSGLNLLGAPANNYFGIGGISGNGATNGLPASGTPHAGNGAGFFTDGAADQCLSGLSTAKSFTNGGAAGGGCTAGFGGFGGGASGGNNGGGGGGGYSGGGGSYHVPTNGGGGGSYNIGTNQVNLAGVGAGNGTITITYSGIGCTSISRTPITVIVNALPTVSVTSGGACPGSSFTITPSGASTYTFSSGSAVVSPTATTNYSVTGTSSVGCVSSNTAVSTVTINATPTVSVTSGAICSGQSFTMVASGASTYNYTGGSAVVSPTATTNYNVTGTNTLGCVSSNTAVSTVTVNASPTISASASSAVICIGEATTLSATASSTTYTWNTGATTASLSVSPTTTTNYTVTTTGTNGCTGTANVNVTVNACTGINEVTASLISVYPNPNNGIVNITLTTALAQNSTLEIYDALGKLVVKQVLANELNTVNISNLDNGIYVFKVLNNNNTVKIGKLIKQ